MRNVTITEVLLSLLGAAIALGWFIPIALAATFTINEAEHTMLIDGEILPDDYERYRQTAFSMGKLDAVWVNSPGGEIGNAILIAAAVHSRQLETAVYTGAECVSACVLIFAAGGKRYLFEGARIGVHRAHEFDGSDSDEGTEYSVDYLRKIGAPAVVISKLRTTNSNNISWLTEIDLKGWSEIVWQDEDHANAEGRIWKVKSKALSEAQEPMLNAAMIILKQLREMPISKLATVPPPEALKGQDIAMW